MKKLSKEVERLRDYLKYLDVQEQFSREEQIEIEENFKTASQNLA